MNSTDGQDKKGFTVIEVALVLAIAGLIFMMVFLALPALNRTQRDSQRRDDMSLFLRNVKDYQTNNRGSLPAFSGSESEVTWNLARSASDDDLTWKGFYKKYLGENFVDPDGEPYTLAIMKCEATTSGGECSNSVASIVNGLQNQSFPNGHKLHIVLQATCSGEKAVGTTNPRKLAALYRLEGAGVYCANT